MPTTIYFLDSPILYNLFQRNHTIDGFWCWDSFHLAYVFTACPLPGMFRYSFLCKFLCLLDFSELISSQGFPMGNRECWGSKEWGVGCRVCGACYTLLSVALCFCTLLTMLSCRTISVFLAENPLIRNHSQKGNIFLRCPIKCNEVMLFRKKFLCFNIRRSFEFHFEDYI